LPYQKDFEKTSFQLMRRLKPGKMKKKSAFRIGNHESHIVTMSNLSTKIPTYRMLQRRKCMTEKIRTVERIITAQPVLEGAGVRLNRVFGFGEEGEFDPFLLLDHFGSADPADYIEGFPWHPHRGMETVTYLVAGRVEHRDSLGNRGIIQSGDLQWMTAGSGIIHQEMPIQTPGTMTAFQLWVNLPALKKMWPPKYRDISTSEVQAVELPGGAAVKVISGTVAGVTGPVNDGAVPVEYLDIALPPHSRLDQALPFEYSAFAYVFEGSGYLDKDGAFSSAKQGVRFGPGNSVSFRTEGEAMRLLLISGKPIGEPIAWQGPIVMTTREELRTAFREYHEGKFVKRY
jgi:redox-sensitive bicupin YhaK (pirin superfamily)